MYRRIGRLIAWALVTSIVLTASLLLHLGSSVGRAAATDLAVAIMNSRIRGTSHIGSITRLDFDGVEMRDITVDSRRGERVMAADGMSAEFAFIESLRRGAIVMTPCVLDGGQMRVTRGPHDQIALVDALGVPADRFMIDLELRDIHMLRQHVVFELPPVPLEVTMGNVSGLVDMSLGHHFEARIDRMRGYVSFPVVHIGFRDLSGRIRSDDARPLIVRMLLDLVVADPGMAITYAAPHAVGRDGRAGLGIELGADVPDASHVATHRAHLASAD